MGNEAKKVSNNFLGILRKKAFKHIKIYLQKHEKKLSIQVDAALLGLI